MILGPIIVIILLYHATLDPKGIGMGLVMTALEVFLIYHCRAHFAALFAPEIEHQ